MINEQAPLQLGKYNRLEVIKELDFGMYLDGFDGEEILIPRVYIPEGTQIGQFLDVFIYRDSEDRLIATTLKPFATVGEFAYLKVKDVSKLGVFLDWGLMKDLLVPFGEQLSKMGVGRSYLVYIYVDEETQRIVASAKIDKFLPKDEIQLEYNQQVDILPYEYTDLGVKVLINNCKIGVIYKNEIFKDVKFGEFTIGYIKKVREDGKIDISLVKQGFDRIDNIKQQIYNKLTEENGFLPYTDKTDSEVIYANLQMSKKDFKKGVGGLFREEKILIKSEGIYKIK
ncbi:CvfB family protein [Arcicella rigui]|uniref:S1-like domain-containing RNA-binding protein n=1 Tax=Arcicella rigui TaxID=797020 RepID=A0ABU5Q686_9BACT|nr:S1-like domain-containing RNA-binding protein [Arcicella rigui]MEA5138067.1 S1-like domain-containing RNA-binding protein [Arcicella rigui]